ncbi:MAG: DUF2914 domain-containing protein [Byssovorax sp.]
MKKPTALFASAALLLIACDDPAPTPAPAPSATITTIATTATTATSVASSAAPTIAGAAAKPSATASATTPSLQMLRLTLTSEVKQKEPVDELKEAGPGQRVWVHLTVRNRAPEARRVSVIFKVDGDERSTIDLQIASSWSFRTWAYNTLRAGDKSGELTVEVRDDAGAVIGTAKLPIKATAAKKAPAPAR